MAVYIVFDVETPNSCASLLVASGVPMKAVQEWLGHCTFNVTVNIQYGNTESIAVHTDKNMRIYLTL